ncbi:MAG: FadR family transcriptional regulator [Deltaproteobacteria bacterium]|nr:FadR family transcriptional regulator [Deltaproteobacteria bacterium]
MHIFNPPKYRRLSEEVYEQIKEAILKGHYEPGERLPSEAVLCKTFGVGRPVVREALRFIENSGLIFVRPGAGGGSFVKKIDSSILTDAFEGIMSLDKVSLEDLVEARMVIELSMFSLIIERIRPEDLEALEQNLIEARKSLEEGIREPKSIGFDIVLANASRNQLLMKITEGLFTLLRKILERHEYSYERKKKILEEHEQIFEYLKAKKYHKAKECLAKHIKNSICYLDDSREEKVSGG